jgi:alpha-galactosidase
MNFSTPLTTYEITGNLDGWNLSFSHTSPENNLEIATWKLKSDAPRKLPVLKLLFRVPQQDSQVKWQPKTSIATLAESHHYLQWWWNGGRNHTSLVKSAPVYSFMNLEGINCVTFALSDALRDTFCSTGPKEEKNIAITTEFELFTVEEAPLTETEFSIRIDRRPLFYADVLRQVSDWYAAMPRYTPSPVPQVARLPLYSSWYQFQKDVSAEKLERELDRIAESGMKVVILDDGWQCEAIQGGGSHYRTCGAWQPFAGKFPDMAGHVQKFHDKGIRYMVWFAVPYVGCEAKEIFERFEGKYLDPEATETRTLDPRYPDVREYIIQTYERAVREWDLDGLKLDFIDQFHLCGRKDPAAQSNYIGCDIKSLPDAVDRLLSDTMSRLRKLKPDIMIEFRQLYIGPAIRKYGNMFRACDCAHDILQNRVRTIDIRLLAGDTATHADMTIWSPEDTAEIAALQLLNVLFSVPQVSVLLEKLPARHWAMVKFWMKFFVDHMETLQHGKLVPLHPELSYPVVTAYGKNETITAVYAKGFAILVDSGRRHLIVNATHGSEVILDIKSVPTSVRAFDVLGKEVKAACPDHAGLVKLQVPPSGYMEVV